MTTKEKASDLFLKFRQVPPCSTYTGIDDGEAKQCALIAVDEIINECGDRCLFSKCDYWQEVKSELEKL